jgi:hypothetical protein
MINLIAKRHSKNAYGTISVVKNDMGKFLFFFLEPIVPIPQGQYHCVRCNHPIHGLCFELKDVPGHTGILIHTGNGAEDTKGCLIPGMELGLYQTKNKVLTFGVLRSKEAYSKLTDLEIDTNLFKITIIDDYAK